MENKSIVLPLSGRDLSYFDLIGYDFSGVNLSFANMQYCKLANANLRNCNLIAANLQNCDLTGADLSSADLRCANLTDSDLSSADLRGANLQNCDLSFANLQNCKLANANLRNCDLSFANLENCDLTGIDLSFANLRCANLTGTDLTDCSLLSACLDRAIITSETKMPKIDMKCPETGSFIGYKKATCSDMRHECVVVLEIPDDAKRSSATGNKCRCSKAKVKDIFAYSYENELYSLLASLSSTTIPSMPSNCNCWHISHAHSFHDFKFVYTVGETVEVDDFDDCRWNECSTGIHFFMSYEEAMDYIA